MNPNSRAARFAAEYVVDHNITQAGIRAGYAPLRAGSNCATLMHKPAVRLAIAEREASLMARVDLTPAKVLREIACIAFADLGRLYGPDGRLLPVPEMDADTLAAVEWLSVRRSSDGRRRIRVRGLDKPKALALLRLHFGRRAPLIEGSVGEGHVTDEAIAAALKRAP